MRLVPTAIAATLVTLMTVPSFAAADKPDGDALLKQIFHGKPGELISTTAGKDHVFKPLPWLFPWTKHPATK